MKRTNFFYLLIALLILLIVIPLADDLNVVSAPIVRGLVFSGLLVIGVWSLKGGGRFYTVGMAFVVAGVILNVLAINTHSLFFQYASILSLIGFMVVAISFTMQQVAVGTNMRLSTVRRDLGHVLYVGEYHFARIVCRLFTDGGPRVGQ